MPKKNLIIVPTKPKSFKVSFGLDVFSKASGSINVYVDRSRYIMKKIENENYLINGLENLSDCLLHDEQLLECFITRIDFEQRFELEINYLPVTFERLLKLTIDNFNKLDFRDAKHVSLTPIEARN